nr:MAG TPA: protein of unknown function (DUF5118) [Caudoviricetes sp.]
MNYNNIKEIFSKAYNTKLQILDYVKKNRNFNNEFKNFCNDLDELNDYNDVQIYFENGKIYLEIPENSEMNMFGAFLKLNEEEIEAI